MNKEHTPAPWETDGRYVNTVPIDGKSQIIAQSIVNTPNNEEDLKFIVRAEEKS